MLHVEKKDQTYLYYPLYNQQEFLSRFVDYLLQDLMVSFFNEKDATLLDPQATTRARELLEELQQRRRDGEA